MISSSETIEKIFRYDVPLQKYTAFRTGGIAEIFVEPVDTLDLKRVLQFCKEEQKEIFIFGKGTNILINDNGVKGVVIHLGGGDFKKVERNGRFVSSGAGVNLPQLVRRTASWGLEGLEVLVGIPGTVGGAVKMNAGGKYGDISETINSLTTMTFDGETTNHNREDVEFSYRESNLNKQIVIKVEFKLKESKKEEILKKMDKIHKEKKERQPLSAFSAGCVFKNTGHFKAAELIDKANLKGRKIGGAIVSRKHANFIINTGNATSSDILELIEIIRETVKIKYDVSLEQEIQIW
ncbi:MAG: UDP-N-acetylmuramate dehydrogenase [Planctomycetota bacterium]|jgi:UDP-N-acetylmuramate dehydrogenase